MGRADEEGKSVRVSIANYTSNSYTLLWSPELAVYYISVGGGAEQGSAANAAIPSLCPMP